MGFDPDVLPCILTHSTNKEYDMGEVNWEKANILSRIEELQSDLDETERVRERDHSAKEYQYGLVWALHLSEEIGRLNEVLERLDEYSRNF